LNSTCFSQPFLTIVTLPAQFITTALEHKYDLVPQKHKEDTKWYKIVLMEPVQVDHLSTFIVDLKGRTHA
jgi:hypothetical protein